MFLYRAIKRTPPMDDWYDFSLADCPCPFWGDSIFLPGKANSPLLISESIVRGNPKTKVYEGDYVYSKQNKLLGIVVYSNGFYMQKSSDSPKKPIPRRHIYMKHGDWNSIKILNTFPDRTPFRFKYLDTIFEFNDFVSIKDGVLVILAHKKPMKVKLSLVSELLICQDDKFRFSGEFVDGHFLDITQPEDTIS